MSKKVLLTILILTAFLVSVPVAVLAFTTKTGDSIYIAKDQEVEGNFYAAANNLTIEGYVPGDVIAAAESITINGSVDGDVIAVAQSITINGEVRGSVRVLATNININNLVNRNINALGSVVVLGSASQTNGDALIAGGMVESRGKINGYLHGYCSKLLISGSVGRNVNFTLNNNESAKQSAPLVVTSDAKISGDVYYKSKTQADINQSSVSGQIVHSVLEAKKGSGVSSIIWHLLFKVFSALVLGLVLIYLFKKNILAMLEVLHRQGWMILASGTAWLFLTPIVAIILLFTVIGIPLALILLVMWLVALYLTKIISAILLGEMLSQKFSWLKKSNNLGRMTMGVVLIFGLGTLPFVGWLISLLAVLVGFGVVHYYFKK